MKLTKSLIDKYNYPVPRYTSYPPANYFHDKLADADYISMVERSNAGQPAHIGFYIHIPFCKKICFYCGCNACALKKGAEVENYIKALKKEIENVIPMLDKNRKVSQIHFGGGTPNAIDAHYLGEIVDLFARNFTFIENPEIAIECNPAYLDFQYIEHLVKAGFNRFSLGIQDFDTSVLKTVNREPSAIPVPELVHFIKQLNSANTVNLDFIYGLPGQTVESFSETISQAIEVRPDRLVTFSYAHVPWLKKHQEILAKKGLPGAEEKMDMFLASREILKAAGYLPVGLDHYVLPNDELNLALRQNLLHRNFQGYCTRRTTGQVYAFGVSAISQLEDGFIQNVKEVDLYISLMDTDKLPIEKGYILSKSEKVIKELITSVMCNNYLDIDSFCKAHEITKEAFYVITGFKVDKLTPFIEDGLLEYTDEKILVSETGELFIRNIAALFDPAYRQQSNLYSKTV
ncbi:MAG TPA: oxygen-independent coproporphyrinogen III oxidase [Bacteroidales bacterium]|nr:oxygen-independent coproporphyrinogen III oxidase [Bacteroidales bacterium]